MKSRNQPRTILIIALVIFAVTCLVPVGFILAQFVVSFFKNPSVIGNILLSSRQLVLLGRSLALALLSTIVALIIGVPAAIVLSAKDLPLKRLFFFLVLVPLLIPSYIMAGAWIHLLSPAGFINNCLANLFGPTVKLSVHSVLGCSWCMGLSFFPIVAVIVATGLSNLDTSLVDTTRLSTGKWGTFRYAILPQIFAHLSASVLLVIIFVLAQYGVPSLLGVNTYPVEIFAQFSAFYDQAAAVATSLPLMALVVFLILTQKRIMKNHEYVRIRPASETNTLIRLNKFKHYAVIFLSALFLITTLIPFISVLAYAKSLTKVISTIRSYGDGIVTTSLLALLAAFVSTAIAFPIGHYLACSRTRFTKVFDILCWLPIAIPGTIIGLGLISVGNSLPIIHNDSFGILLLLAYIGMFSAFSIRILKVSIEQSDPNIEEAATLDCQYWYQRFFYIDIPIHLPALAASMIIVFVLAVGELNATVLLIPPGKATLSVSIDNLLHYGANTTASALCLIEAGLVILAIVFGLFVSGFFKKVLQ